MKNNTILVLLLLFAFTTVEAQIAPDKYYVQFTDKNDSPFTISEPEEFLTLRAIKRREKNGVAIAEEDLPVNPDYLNGVKNKGVKLLNASRWLNGVTIETDDPSLLELVESLPYVDSVSILDSRSAYRLKPFEEPFSRGEGFVPNYSEKSSSASDYAYGYGEFQITQINGVPLHLAGYNGEGIMIAVLDGGFTGVQEHPVFDSLWANGQVLGARDFVNGGENVYTESGHGRSVLSTMAANSPGVMVGTAPGADYWLLRSEDVKSENVIEEFNWVSAAEFADSVGADVINSSLSYVDFDIPAWDYTHEKLDGKTAFSTFGAVMAMRKGILVCNSAGNSGSSEFPWNGAPADADSILSVGAVDVSDFRVSFSSTGPTGDGRIKPDVMALGAATIVAYGTDTIGPGYGTSFASPIIAGMSACLIQANQDTDLQAIIASIRQSGSNSSTPDNEMGWGIPDYELANSVMTTVENNLKETARAHVWPNPFSGNSLTVEFTESYAGGYLQIVDLAGNILYQQDIPQGARKQRLGSLYNLSSGMYFLRLVINDEVEVVKIVRQ
ncbi:MAG: S8 family peptidase [bacterium]